MMVVKKLKEMRKELSWLLLVEYWALTAVLFILSITIFLPVAIKIIFFP